MFPARYRRAPLSNQSGSPVITYTTAALRTGRSPANSHVRLTWRSKMSPENKNKCSRHQSSHSLNCHGNQILFHSESHTKSHVKVSNHHATHCTMQDIRVSGLVPGNEICKERGSPFRHSDEYCTIVVKVTLFIKSLRYFQTSRLACQVTVNDL